MIFVFLITFLFSLVFVRIKDKNDTAILDKTTTKSIEGILAIYIIFSHLKQYIPYDDFGSDLLNNILNNFGQCSVAPFFFFSGFGIVESIKKKGATYSKTILTNRFLRVWCWFIIALVPFYLLDLFWFKQYSLLDYIAAPLGIKSIGNSNWFVAIILLCYFSIGFSCFIFKSSIKKQILFSSLIIFIYFVFAYLFKLPTYWYDTVLCFPLGMVCSYNKVKIQTILSDSVYRIFIPLYILLFIVISYFFPIYILSKGIVFHEIIRNLLFSLLILSLSVKLKFKKSIFAYLGTCSFSIFIFQRLPMMVLKELLSFSSKYIYWILSIVLSIILGVILKSIFDICDNHVTNKINDFFISKLNLEKEAYKAEIICNKEIAETMSSDKTNIRFGIIINYFSFAVSIIGAFFVTKKVLLFVGDYEYGLYSFALSITSWLTVVTAALNSSFIRFSMRQREAEGSANRTNTIYLKLFSIIASFALVIFGFLIIVLVLLKISLPSYSLSDSLYIYLLLFLSLINVCVSIPSAFFSLFISLNKKFIFSNSFSLLITILGYIFHFYIAYQTHMVLGITIYTIFCTLFTGIINFWFCKNKLNLHFMKTKLSDNKPLLKSIAAFSSIVVFNVIVDQINSQVDKSILGFLGLTTDVTIYHLGQTFAIYLTTVSLAVSGPFVPSINECVAKNNYKSIDDIFLKISRLQTIVVVMVAFGFLSCGKEMVSIWLGDGYVRVFYIGSLLMLLNICPLTINSSIEIQRAQNKHLFRAVVYFIIAILNVFMSIMFIRFFPSGFEIYGCVLGTIISTVLSHWILMNWYNSIKMHLPIRKYFAFLFLHILLGLISYLPTILLNNFTFLNNRIVVLFLSKGVIFVIIYLLGVIIIDRTFLITIKKSK